MAVISPFAYGHPANTNSSLDTIPRASSSYGQSNKPPTFSFRQPEYVIRLPQQSLLVEWDAADIEDDLSRTPVRIVPRLMTNGIDVTEMNLSEPKGKTFLLHHLEDGIYTLTAYAVDSRDSRSAPQTTQIIVWKEDADSPQVFVSGPRLVYEGQIVPVYQARTFQFKGNLNYSWISLDGKLNLDNYGSSSQLPLGRLQIGTYYLKAVVTDSKGSRVETPFMVQVDGRLSSNQRPTIAMLKDRYTVILPTSTFSLNVPATDPEGSMLSYRWEMTSGQRGIDIEGLETPQLSLSSLKEGNYSFRLSVTDDSGAISMTRFDLEVQPAPMVNRAEINPSLAKTDKSKEPVSKVESEGTSDKEGMVNQGAAVVTQQPGSRAKGKTKEKAVSPGNASEEEQHTAKQNNVNQDTNASANSVIISEKPREEKVVPAVESPNAEGAGRNGRLTQQQRDYAQIIEFTGGPGNAFLNLLVPGLGHYRVSGPMGGSMRKKSSFLITTAFFATAGVSAYYRMQAVDQYNAYKNFASAYEYQNGAGGSIIGIRAAKPSVADSLLNIANATQSTFKNVAYAAIGILSVDFIYTLVKGISNSNSYRKMRNGSVGLRYDPVSKTLLPTLRISIGNSRQDNPFTKVR